MGAGSSRAGPPSLAPGLVPVCDADYRIASHEILPRLRLGDLSAACDPDELAESGVTHIVSAVGVEGRARERGVRHFIFNVDDSLDAPIGKYFVDSHRWIDAALAGSPKHVVLVHCVAGVSRSATIVIAYVMRTRRLRLAEAHALVQRARTIVNPNAGFRLALQQFEKHLFDGGAWPPDGSAAPTETDAKIDDLSTAIAIASPPK